MSLFFKKVFVLYKVSLCESNFHIEYSIYSFNLTRCVLYLFSGVRVLLVPFKLYLGFITICVSNCLIISFGIFLQMLVKPLLICISPTYLDILISG